VTIQLPHFDLCAIAPSAFTYWVPQTQGAGMVATSGSGGYYYTSLCKAFVVDIKMATYSATDPVDGLPTNPSGELIIATEPYDLPSSQAFGGTTPIVGEDCGRLKYSARYYRRLDNEDHLTHLADFKATTNWDSPVCDVTVDGGVHAYASQDGWDTYRVAVAVVLRSSAQEVAVTFIEAPPT
jgi:hypothetical protein